MRNLEETLEACHKMGFGPEITAETCWNEGYRLGRKRWYWGPHWFVGFVGWINTQKQRILRNYPTKKGHGSNGE